MRCRWRGELYVGGSGPLWRMKLDKVSKTIAVCIHDCSEIHFEV
jgi:hypothetical protein